MPKSMQQQVRAQSTQDTPPRNPRPAAESGSTGAHGSSRDSVHSFSESVELLGSQVARERALSLALFLTLAIDLSLSLLLALPPSALRFPHSFPPSVPLPPTLAIILIGLTHCLSRVHVRTLEQVAVKVAKEGSLLVFPHTLPDVSSVAQACLHYMPHKRPTFLEIVQVSRFFQFVSCVKEHD